MRPPKTKLSKNGKINGRPVKVPDLPGDDGIRDIPPRGKSAKPFRFYYENTALLVLSKRGGDTIADRARWLVMNDKERFPLPADRTERAVNAVRRFLLDPYRSLPPSAASLAEADRKRLADL